mmetsp:Transcript_14123/g.24048  ORF Transcript_14123/g.24048 Transcript_14123/m.24048 type:complete len:95 (-) Transcript_14123:85-369(-)
MGPSVQQKGHCRRLAALLASKQVPHSVIDLSADRSLATQLGTVNGTAAKLGELPWLQIGTRSPLNLAEVQELEDRGLLDSMLQLCPRSPHSNRL